MAIPARSRGAALVRARSSLAVRRLLLPAQQFLHTETTSGGVLLVAAVFAIVWANSPWAWSYEAFWSVEASFHVAGFALSHSLREWINDALMVMFFFVVGLEVKREFVRGELAQWKRASLPVVCAIGGMLVPAALYTALNHGGDGSRGWGIPMATDIAFALGVLALVGHRAPAAIRIFLLALATVDDIGAIVVIAVFYSDRVSVLALAIALTLIATIICLQRVGVQNPLFFVPFAVALWLAVLESGVHATIAGVVLGLVTPTGSYVSRQTFAASAERLLKKVKQGLARGQQDKAERALGQISELTTATEPMADRLLRLLHPWSSYIALPIFAMANVGVPLTLETARHAVSSSTAHGIILGLVLGKAAGIALFAAIAIRLGVAAALPSVGSLQMAGVGLLGGIGFTVSLFISDLAFTNARLIAEAKLAILVASVLSGVLGFVVLRFGRSAHGGELKADGYVAAS